MSELKADVAKRTLNLSIPWFTILQCVMLVARYGFKMDLPWWATWFPSIIWGGFLCLIGFIFIIGILVVVIGALLEK